jgi:hypothetical protein
VLIDFKISEIINGDYNDDDDDDDMMLFVVLASYTSGMQLQNLEEKVSSTFQLKMLKIS